jgi:hypothetical protein
MSEVAEVWPRYARGGPEGSSGMSEVVPRWLGYTRIRFEVTEVSPKCLRCVLGDFEEDEVGMRYLKCV